MSQRKTIFIACHPPYRQKKLLDTSLEISAESRTSGSFTLFLSTDLRFADNFNTDTENSSKFSRFAQHTIRVPHVLVRFLHSIIIDIS